MFVYIRNITLFRAQVLAIVLKIHKNHMDFKTVNSLESRSYYKNTKYVFARTSRRYTVPMENHFSIFKILQHKRQRRTFEWFLYAFMTHHI